MRTIKECQTFPSSNALRAMASDGEAYDSDSECSYDYLVRMYGPVEAPLRYRFEEDDNEGYPGKRRKAGQTEILLKFFDKLKPYIFTDYQYWGEGHDWWYVLPGFRLPSTHSKKVCRKRLNRWYEVFYLYGRYKYMDPEPLYYILGMPSMYTFRHAWISWCRKHFRRGERLFYSKDHYHYFHPNDIQDHRTKSYSL